MPSENTERPNVSVKVIIGLAVVLVLGAVAYFIAGRNLSLSEAIRTGEAPRPELTTENTIASQQEQPAFSALISYTDQGFEPKMLSIQRGETIRFTNNSSNSLHLIVNADTITEHDLLSQKHVDITFAQTGLFQYNASPDTAKGGMVNVQ